MEAALPLFIILFISSFLVSLSESKLTTNYYQRSCPRMEQIVQDTVTNKQITSPTTAGGTLRVFFHDCMVEGCDASVLITSTAFNKAERDDDINLSLPGDAFDVVVRAKIAIELACPGVVSCADILALATRDLVTMVGGPFYEVQLGRKDGLVSKSSLVAANLPKSTTPISDQIALFASKGFSVQEMVALVGAHTIGFSHCKEFAGNVFNYSKSSMTDPAYNPRFAEGLRKACTNYPQNPTISVSNDVMTPGKFDNMYFQNLPRGLGLLPSDHFLSLDARTRPYVERYAADQSAFFQDFSRAMEKLGMVGIKTGQDGEVRRRCDAFNNIKT